MTPAGGAGSLPLTPSPRLVLPARLGVASIPTPAPGTCITLEQALALATANEPTFIAAALAAKTARLERNVAVGRVLPSALYHNQYLYTQSETAGARNKSPDLAGQPKFINNDLVHHYFSQVSVSETIGLTGYSAVERANANLSLTEAQAEVVERGLVSTVTGLFYNLITDQDKVLVQERAVREAGDFLQVTELREAAREGSHFDVIKARLQMEQRQRDLITAQLLSSKAHIDLGVLLYPDPRSPYSVAAPEARPLLDRAAFEAVASANNVDLRSAFAAFQSSQSVITTARAAFLPDLALNYAYGIDAPQFAANGRDGQRWLGYAASMTLDIPLFDWFATPNKLKEAHVARDAARAVLTNAQRRIIANVEEYYNQAQVSQTLLQSLRDTVVDAREGLRLARLRFESGETTVLEVVDAQSTLVTAELALEDGTTAYQLALVQIQTLTGK